MSKNYYLLDCTLRDGGYTNDWDFGRDNIVSIFERLVSSGVDMIEVGFLDERRKFDPDRTIMPDTESVDRIFGMLDAKQAMKVAMIDYGTCGIDKIQPCKDSWLDGIRVIFKKEIRDNALAYCAQLKELGYHVFVQAVSITSYTDDELRDLICKVNLLKPYAISMVDTYGLLDPASLMRICGIIHEMLDPSISLGFHAHNNFQLGYANAMTLLNAKLDREVVVDGTLYGMGKSAGNAPVELIAMYMNANFAKSYDVSQMQEAISTSVLDMYSRQPWGYTLFYYIAASNHVHPDYVAYLMNKRTLSVTAVNEILQMIPEEKKLGKDMKMIEALYLNYQNLTCNDENSINALRTLLNDNHVLILGPGVSITSYSHLINQYIQNSKCAVISVNYIPKDIPVDYLFLTNSKRFLSMSGMLLENKYKDIPVIATSNITRSGRDFPYVVNYSSLIDSDAEFPDNSMVMLLKLLHRIGVDKIALAGFDGYTPDNLNYFNNNMEYSFVKEKADSLNAYGKQFFAKFSQTTEVFFITPSRYLD